jgi:hypothetical protein
LKKSSGSAVVYDALSGHERCDAVIYKHEKRLPAVVHKSKPWILLKWFISQAQLDIFSLTFILQKWKLCWSCAKAFYFVPHLASIGICVLGAVLPAPRACQEYQTLKLREDVSNGDKKAVDKKAVAGKKNGENQQQGRFKAQ